jgi:hypothetical protein
MGKVVREQINFNTVLIILVGGLITLGLKRFDDACTEITKMQEHQGYQDQRMDHVESYLGIFKPSRSNVPAGAAKTP